MEQLSFTSTYTFRLNLDWEIVNEISKIERFGASWTAIEKREGRNLKQLKSMATVRSVGASTRIEGSKMTDAEVEVLIKNLDVAKLEERDAQEVVGYYEVMDVISESFRDINIYVPDIKNLHNILLKYSKKDEWHKGNYKQHSNAVEATHADGTKHIVFKTTDPGFKTENAMMNLLGWYNTGMETHPIIKTALFIYEFLTIHPFQDGNGRLSRLLTTLLLLRNGYSWIDYISFEHEIERRKAEYYRVLIHCQQQRPGEDVHPWVMFFLSCLHNIQNLLMDKVNLQSRENQMAPREKMIYVFIENHPGCKSGDVAEKLDIPLPTIKKILANMVKDKLLVKLGVGAGTNYMVENMPVIQKNVPVTLTSKKKKKEFVLMNQASFIEIKKISLMPLFKWTEQNDWYNKLRSQNMGIRISSESKRGLSFQNSMDDYVSPYNLQPELTLREPINIPQSLWGIPKHDEFPLTISIEIISSVPDFDFDVTIVYDRVE